MDLALDNQQWLICHKTQTNKQPTNLKLSLRGARGEMVIVVGNEHGDTSSNPGRD